MRLAALAAAGLLSGCGGTLVFHSPDEARQAIVAETQLVLPHIKPAHLEECRKMVEAVTFLGAQYKIAPNARFAPSFRHSCLAQGRSSTGMALETDQKSAVLVVRMIKVAGMFGTGAPEEDRGCVFRITKGDAKVSVTPASNTAPADSWCHYL
jgi:hypothetical protein